VLSVGVINTLWFDANVTYLLPSGLRFVSGDRCTANGQTVTCMVGPDHLGSTRPTTLVGEGISVTLTAGAATLGGPITATLAGGTGDPDQTNNTATIALTPAAPPTTLVVPTPNLPATGTQTGSIALVAGMSVVLGCMVLLTARRRITSK
jgi:LPXTG-motif cell wall-anchored protein